MLLSKDTTLRLKKSFAEFVGYENIWDNKALLKGKYQLIDELKSLPPGEQEELIRNFNKANELFGFPCKVILLDRIILFDTFNDNAIASIKRFGGKVLDIASITVGAGLGPIALVGLAPVVAAKELRKRLGSESKDLASFIINHDKELSEMIFITPNKCSLIEITEPNKSFFGGEKNDLKTLIIYGEASVFGVEKEEVIRTTLHGKTSEIIEVLSSSGFARDKIKTTKYSIDNV